MEGWIKLHRKIQETQLYPKNREFTKFEAWLDLLILVNHKDNEVLLGNELILCKRGESIRSIESYQKRWSWSRQQVRSFFCLLERQTQIHQKTTSKTTIISICKYDTYQDEQPAQQPTDNQRITTNKNDKNEKNIKKYKNTLLSELTASDVEPKNVKYLEAAKSFFELFKNNLSEAGASTVQIEKTKGTWVDDIRLIIEADKYTVDDLRTVWQFLKTDSFWKKNIQSAATLRAQMSKLKLQIHSNGKNKSISKEACSPEQLASVIFEKFGDLTN
jgi:DNA replication protein DnaD